LELKQLKQLKLNGNKSKAQAIEATGALLVELKQLVSLKPQQLTQLTQFWCNWS
jgi:hypothetical protein